MFTVTAEPTQAFVDAFSARLKADAALMALIHGVFAHLSEADGVDYPYLVLGRRTMDRHAGAMGLPGANVSLQLDGWSDAKGPYQMHRIMSRVSVLHERKLLAVPCFDVLEGSVTCEYSDVSDEPDTDIPTAALYHGVQRWAAEIHECR